MYKREKCIYCGNIITKRSKEHVIQNAIGGLYESEDICCHQCNEYLSKYIDEPFTKTFSCITSRINNFTKTNNTKSSPLCTGKAIYQDEIYDVQIKKGKIVGCPELCKRLKRNIKDIPLKLISYDFKVDNISFNNGIKKIAFNFAIDKGIDINKISEGLEVIVEEGQVKDIKYNYAMIPFIPLNPMDEYIELNTELELYHNLILFSQGNNLWCYIDLFNTFQYYVLLSDKWDNKYEVLETYLQLIQKLDKTQKELYIRKPKHMLTYSMLYNVEPCNDIEEFKKRVNIAIQKESQKKEMSEVISAKLKSNYFRTDLLKEMEKEEAQEYLQKDMAIHLKSLLLYFDEDDKLKDSTFRQVTLIGEENEVISYPTLIELLLSDGKVNVKNYTFNKFERLNDFLIEDNMVKTNEN